MSVQLIKKVGEIRELHDWMQDYPDLFPVHILNDLSIPLYVKDDDKILFAERVSATFFYARAVRDSLENK